MIVVVFDVNVLVSSLILRGKPRELWFKAVSGEFTLVLSTQIVSEFVDVVSRRKFRRYVGERDVRVFLGALYQTAKLTRVRSRFKAVASDPADDLVLRTAHDGGADHVVSGDRHLLDMKMFRSIRIVTVDDMLERLTQERTEE
jgi:putative PIN family toxin of toxin-antitoxin system